MREWLEQAQESAVHADYDDYDRPDSDRRRHASG